MWLVCCSFSAPSKMKHLPSHMRAYWWVIKAAYNQGRSQEFLTGGGSKPSHFFIITNFFLFSLTGGTFSHDPPLWLRPCIQHIHTLTNMTAYRSNNLGFNSLLGRLFEISISGLFDDFIWNNSNHSFNIAPILCANPVLDKVNTLAGYRKHRLSIQICGRLYA